MAHMNASFNFLWTQLPAAAGAAWIDLGAKRSFWLVLLLIVCVVAALRAYLAPAQERWTAVRNQWPFALRDVFLVTLAVSLYFFGYELLWNQPARTLENGNMFSASGTIPRRIPTSFPSALSAFNTGRYPRTICVRVPLPDGFSGGTYTLPFKPAGPSPPVLYNNGQLQRKGVDYTVSDGSINVGFAPKSKDALVVMYTTDDVFADYLQ